MNYSFAAVWWVDKEVDQAAFDVYDAAQQEMLKQQDVKRRQNAEDALRAQRDKDKQNEKTEIERKLRETNGTKARGLMNYIHDLVRGMAEQHSWRTPNFFRFIQIG